MSILIIVGKVLTTFIGIAGIILCIQTLRGLRRLKKKEFHCCKDKQPNITYPDYPVESINKRSGISSPISNLRVGKEKENCENHHCDQ
jgi:hypothetical protein